GRTSARLARSAAAHAVAHARSVRLRRVRRRPMSVGLRRKKSDVLFTALYIWASATQSFLISLSKTSGGFAYDPSSVVCLQEGLKLLTAVASEGLPELRALGRSGSLAVPAVLAALHGNLVFLAHLYLSPPMYHFLSLSRILVTGILFRVILQQELQAIQWIALLQLAIAIAGTSQIDCSSGEDRTTSDASEWKAGMTIVLVLAVCSSLSGAQLQLRGPCNHLVLQMYSFVASLGLHVMTRTKGPLEGYSKEVYLMVLMNGLLGLVTRING
ncbi:unnamed protein product, partial [Durusdinium trenchii]